MLRHTTVGSWAKVAAAWLEHEAALAPAARVGMVQVASPPVTVAVPPPTGLAVSDRSCR